MVQWDNSSATVAYSDSVPSNGKEADDVDDATESLSLHAVDKPMNVPESASTHAFSAGDGQADSVIHDEKKVHPMKLINEYLGQHGQSPVTLSDVDHYLLVQRLKPANLLQPKVDGPLVSVIMPAWNAEASIRGSALSILQQTWAAIELIIVDDASTDGTWQEMLELAAAHDNVKVMRNVVNVGPYVSKNMALLRARGKYVTGHDSDDWAHPQRIEMQMRPILKSFGLVRATITYALKLENDMSIVGHPVVDSAHEFKMSSPDGMSRTALISLLIDRQWMLEKLGSWDAVAYGADGEILHRIGTMVGLEGLKTIPAVGIFYMSRKDSLSTRGGGYTSPTSPRLLYRRAWAEWHEQVKRSKDAFLPFPQDSGRLFPAPDEAVVAFEKICKNMRIHGFRCESWEGTKKSYVEGPES